MGILIIPVYYIFWHYTSGVSDFLRIWKNFLWFFYNLFSIPILLQTLFVPFRRLQEKRVGGFSIEASAENIVANILMRLVGFFARLIIIVIGIIMLTLVVISGLALFVVWFLLPVIVPILLVWGFYLIK